MVYSNTSPSGWRKPRQDSVLYVTLGLALFLHAVVIFCFVALRHPNSESFFESASETDPTTPVTWVAVAHPPSKGPAPPDSSAPASATNQPRTPAPPVARRPPSGQHTAALRHGRTTAYRPAVIDVASIGRTPVHADSVGSGPGPNGTQGPVSLNPPSPYNGTGANAGGVPGHGVGGNGNGANMGGETAPRQIVHRRAYPTQVKVLYNNARACGLPAVALRRLHVRSWEDLCAATGQELSALQARPHEAPFLLHSPLQIDMPDELAHLTGLSGTVTLSIDVTAQGSTANIVLASSSGNDTMDRIATWVPQHLQWLPALSYGQPSDEQLQLTVVFGPEGTLPTDEELGIPSSTDMQ